MFPRGRMYSEKEAEWPSPRTRNNSSSSSSSSRSSSSSSRSSLLLFPCKTHTSNNSKAAATSAEGQTKQFLRNRLNAGASHSVYSEQTNTPKAYIHRKNEKRGREERCSSSSSNSSSSGSSISPSANRHHSRSPPSIRKEDIYKTDYNKESKRDLFRNKFHEGSAVRTPQRAYRRWRSPEVTTGHSDKEEDENEYEERYTAATASFFPWGSSSSSSSSRSSSSSSRNRGGGIGFRGRGRRGPPLPCWDRFNRRENINYRNNYSNNKRSSSSSSSSSRLPSVDSGEELRRSRSREKARRRRQYETIQRYCRPNGEQQVCWDGFQWVRKKDNKEVMFDSSMNATRRARRLHIGNLPLLLDATEEELKKFLWENIRRKVGRCTYTSECPILHIWFCKERGGNYGFVEMASVEDAQMLLSLNPLMWKGQPLRINRPTDWKKDTNEINFAEVSGTANVPLLESVAAAAAAAETTGDGSALAKLILSLPEDQKKIIADFLVKSPTGLTKTHQLPVELLQCQIQAELLHGQPSRVVRITNPVPDAVTDEEMEETLSDVLGEINKKNNVLAALIITKNLEKLLPAAELGDIYIQFATGIQADMCIFSFAGRMYDGRPLVIERFNEMVWRQTMQKHAKSLLKDILAKFI